jgi:putative heme-binding domain-containing protein
MLRPALTLATAALASSLVAAGIEPLPVQPAPVDVRAGAALYAGSCADCHGADGTGVSGPDLTGLWTSGRTDEQVMRAIRLGRPGSIMPPSSATDDELRAIVAFVKSLGTAAGASATAMGDVARGQDIFSSTCAGCHRIGTRGGRLGPDLSRIAATQSRAQLVRAIRQPSASVAAAYRAVTLVTGDGQTIRGARKSEDAFSIQILDTRERLQGYLKAGLRELKYDGRSLMPDFGPDRLGESDLEDLLQFLGTLRDAEGGRR